MVVAGALEPTRSPRGHPQFRVVEGNLLVRGVCGVHSFVGLLRVLLAFVDQTWSAGVELASSIAEIRRQTRSAFVSVSTTHSPNMMARVLLCLLLLPLATAEQSPFTIVSVLMRPCCVLPCLAHSSPPDIRRWFHWLTIARF